MIGGWDVVGLAFHYVRSPLYSYPDLCCPRIVEREDGRPGYGCLLCS